MLQKNYQLLLTTLTGILSEVSWDLTGTLVLDMFGGFLAVLVLCLCVFVCVCLCECLCVIF